MIRQIADRRQPRDAVERHGSLFCGTPMPPALTPALALDYVHELSADVRAGVVLDARGRPARRTAAARRPRARAARRRRRRRRARGRDRRRRRLRGPHERPRRGRGLRPLRDPRRRPPGPPRRARGARGPLRRTAARRCPRTAVSDDAEPALTGAADAPDLRGPAPFRGVTGPTRQWPKSAQIAGFSATIHALEPKRRPGPLLASRHHDPYQGRRRMCNDEVGFRRQGR